MHRLQKKLIASDLDKKMVFLTGPRQVGKTTLAKSLQKIWHKLDYLNADAQQDRMIIHRQQWDRGMDLVVLDEIHREKNWKTRLKGVYDTEGIPPRILVTGSARLDVFRRGGDSLAGRYFLHRLYPLSVRELKKQGKPQEILEQLISLGGFPEPFLSGSAQSARRWRKNYLDRVIRGDLRDMQNIREIHSLLLLVDLLRERVGSPLSYAALARDVQVSPHTVEKWIRYLANLYLIFLVYPYHRNVARALLKRPKVYFFDTGAVRGDTGAKFENLMALHLKKWLDYLADAEGQETELFYLRDKEGREVDFVICQEKKLTHLIEAKSRLKDLSPALAYFTKRLHPNHALQLSLYVDRSRSIEGISLKPAARWLAELAI